MIQGTSLIIGGTAGIGLATARQLHERGNAVHIAGRSAERVESVRTSDPDLVGHQADARDRSAIAALAASIGPIDHLIITATSAGGAGPVKDLDLDAVRRAFEGKVLTALSAIQAVLPHLSAEGSITVLSSISPRAALRGTVGLGAVNGAIDGMIRPLAVELAPIRVNAVSPGVTATGWWSGMPDGARQEFFDETAAALPTGRIGTAEQVAEVVVLAATNGNITGTVLETDGGTRLVSMTLT